MKNISKDGPVQPPPARRRHGGLRKGSPEELSKASDETAAQVNRIGLTFVGTTAFCLLSLLSPDTALLGSNEKISVPLAGPVSFPGFMVLGPAVLIGLRAYLQIYVEHGERLDRLTRKMAVKRVPTLVPLRNWAIWIFSIFTFYLLLPLTMATFAWKAAAFPEWGAPLLSVGAGVIVSHVLLPLRGIPWGLRGLLSVVVMLFVAGFFIVGARHDLMVRRPFHLRHADLSGQVLFVNFQGANLDGANLSGADLFYTIFNNAFLVGANLSNAHATCAKFRAANLGGAKLTAADLRFADLSGANQTAGGSDRSKTRDMAAGGLGHHLPYTICRWKHGCIVFGRPSASM